MLAHGERAHRRGIPAERARQVERAVPNHTSNGPITAGPARAHPDQPELAPAGPELAPTGPELAPTGPELAPTGTELAPTGTELCEPVGKAGP